MAGRSQHYTVNAEKSSDLTDLLVTPDDATVSTKKSSTKCISIFCIIFLVIFAIATSIAVVVLGVLLGVRTAQLNDASSSSQPSGNTSDNNTCLTPGCIQLAAQVQASLNQSADPCQDFYQFACGNWVRNNIIPEGSLVPKYGVFSEEIQRDTVGVRVRKILESGNDGGVEAVGKALRLYQSCINNTVVDSLGAAPLLDVIRTQTGGWPLIGIPDTGGPWSINSSSLFYQKAHGSDVFFALSFNFNNVIMNNTYYVPVIIEQVKYFLNQGDDTNQIRSSLVNTLMLLNASVNQSLYEEAVDEVLDLDTKIKSIIVPAPPDLVNNSRYQYTVEGLQTLFPEFDWKAFLTYIYNIGGLAVPSDVMASVVTPAFFPKLVELFRNTTDKSVIRNYANLFFVKAVSQFLGGPFAASREPATTRPGNSASCIMFVEDILPIALARPYVEQYVPEGTRENISMLADFLVKGFGERVREMNWLSDFSKQATLEKVNALTSMVAYPADILNNDYVNGLYSTFTANASDYFGNKLRGMEIKLRTQLSYTLGFDKGEWSTVDQGAAPTTINAFYNPATNQFYVTVVDLAPPIFNADWPDYFNFGALGSVVGHEITHGFDSDGQMRDKDGIRRMWWSQQSQAEFNRRTQCFVNQYNQYSYLGVQVNGMRSLPENLADNGGLHTSFQAYRMRVAESGKEPQRLPALPYTPEQLFFIAFGQVWCEVATPFWYQLLADNDNHAPGIARANTVVNVKEFAEAFNCPVGTPMNPAEKCLIW